MRLGLPLLIALLTLTVSQAAAQLPDTVFVTSDKFVYLVFNSPVTMAHLADRNHFAYKQEGDMLVIKSKKVNPEPTTLMVRTNTTINVTILAYKENITNFLYDLRAQEPNVSEPTEEEVAKSETKKELKRDGLPELIIKRYDEGYRDAKVGDIISQANMYRVLASEPEFNNNMGTEKDGLYFFLYNIYVDDKYAYFKFRLDNTSSIGFDIDFFSFEVLQGGKVRKNEASQTTLLPFVFKESVKSVHPVSHEDLIYVLDLYAFKTKDKLKVKVSELDGDRSLDFNIPAKLISNAKRF